MIEVVAGMLLLLGLTVFAFWRLGASSGRIDAEQAEARERQQREHGEWVVSATDNINKAEDPPKDGGSDPWAI